MTKNVSFDTVPGLADVVTLRPDRPDLFPADKKKKTPPPAVENTPETYAALCAEITEVLRRAAAHDRGSVAVEIFRDERLPAALRGRIVPATVRMETETFPGRVVREQGLVVYLSPADMRRERERRGYAVRCRVMPVRRFLDLAGENNLGARFMVDGCRFDLTRTQFNYIRAGAASLFREDTLRLEREHAALAAAHEAEWERISTDNAAGTGNRFFTPRLDVIAAVNADLPVPRRQACAADFLLRHTAMKGQVLVEALDEDELPRHPAGCRLPRISRIPDGKRERRVITAYLSDEIPFQKMMEEDTVIRYYPSAGRDLALTAIGMRVDLRLVSTLKELIVPREILAKRLEESGKD